MPWSSTWPGHAERGLESRGCRAVRPFPPRTQEADMPELTRRYLVMTMATDGPFDMNDPETPFVLKPWKDPASLRARATYREHRYRELAEEVGGWTKEGWGALMSEGQIGRAHARTR